mmetsp:Transcript_19883/g.48809  ORF Transcript_19883/g.48809 Transcript_19883/m.48809 type:complete len:371 (-) Transcript_19883:83-1195(-)
MKFIQSAFLFALLPSTFGLRGAQEHRNLEGELVNDSPTDAPTNTTTQSTFITGYVPGNQCVDTAGLCEAYLGIAVGALGTDDRMAEAAAEFLCGLGAEAFGASYATFTGQMQMEVEHNMGLEKINSIELHSQLSTASGALAFTGAEAVAAVGAGGQAFVYTDNSTFCESATHGLNQDQLGLLMPCPTFAYAESAAVAEAGSFSSGLAESFAAGHAHTAVKVEGKDIDMFQAFTIAGVSSFTASDSIAASGAFAAAWSEAVSVAEASETICQPWFHAYCEQYSHTEFCLQEAGVVCDHIFAFAGAHSEALAASFAAAGASAAAAIELTFAVTATVKGGMDGEPGFAKLGIHLDIENDPDYVETGLVATCNN